MSNLKINRYKQPIHVVSSEFTQNIVRCIFEGDMSLFFLASSNKDEVLLNLDNSYFKYLGKPPLKLIFVILLQSTSIVLWIRLWTLVRGL